MIAMMDRTWFMTLLQARKLIWAKRTIIPSTPPISKIMVGGSGARDLLLDRTGS